MSEFSWLDDEARKVKERAARGVAETEAKHRSDELLKSLYPEFIDKLCAGLKEGTNAYNRHFEDQTSLQIRMTRPKPDSFRLEREGHSISGNANASGVTVTVSRAHASGTQSRASFALTEAGALHVTGVVGSQTVDVTPTQFADTLLRELFR